MNKFKLIDKIRNKIRIKGILELNISKSAKLVGCKIISKGHNRLIIGKNTILRDVNIELLGENNLISIGENCMIGHNSYLSVKESSNIIIGNNSALSRNIKIMTSDGHSILQDKKRINYAQHITLGNSVWLADNVTILKGVSIGDNSIVGINSTLTKSINSNVIAAGNPAKIIKENITWIM